MLAVYVICSHRVYIFDDTEDMRALLAAANAENGTTGPDFPATEQLEILLDSAEECNAFEPLGFGCNRMYVVNLEW